VASVRAIAHQEYGVPPYVYAGTYGICQAITRVTGNPTRRPYLSSHHTPRNQVGKTGTVAWRRAKVLRRAFRILSRRRLEALKTRKMRRPLVDRGRRRGELRRLAASIVRAGGFSQPPIALDKLVCGVTDLVIHELDLEGQADGLLRWMRRLVVRSAWNNFSG
jgi:hypothetical protein